MIRLHQFRRCWGIPNPSIFCMKVETWLRMARLPYEVVLVDNPGKLPKGKAPVIDDGGTTVPDSTFILKYLDEKYRPGIDAGLTERDLAVANAFGRMIEERYYWALVYARWIDERWWPEIRREFFGPLPALVRPLVAQMAQRNVKSSLRGHGLGRHTADEIYALGREDLASIASFLADKPYFMGEEPASIDAIVYAAIANTVSVPHETPMKSAAAAHPNIERYCGRMRARYFPEAEIGDSWKAA